MNLMTQFSPFAIEQSKRIIGAVEHVAGHTQLDSATAPQQPAKNSAGGDSGKGKGKGKGTTLDSATEAFADQYVASYALAVVNEWVATDDLEPGESLADRLVNTLVGIADENADGELSEDETAVALESFTSAAAYMQNMGASESDAEAIFGDDLAAAAAAADRVRDLLASALPDGSDAESSLLDSVVFSDEDQESVMDSAFKRAVAVRGGKKVIINKRISGTAKLSSKQKLALRKARSKAFGAQAMMRRAKSMRVRAQLGLNR